MFGLGAKVPQMSPAELQAELKKDRPPVVVDVRTLGEFRTGHIPGARLIPLGELGGRTAEIPKDQTVVTVCRSGSRSQMAARQLQKLGYEVFNMAGGMNRWDGKTVR